MQNSEENKWTKTMWENSDNSFFLNNFDFVVEKKIKQVQNRTAQMKDEAPKIIPMHSTWVNAFNYIV